MNWYGAIHSRNRAAFLATGTDKDRSLGSSGDDVLRDRVPFIQDELEFIPDVETMIRTAPYYGSPEIEDQLYGLYRGSKTGNRDLPWLDVELCLPLIESKHLGHDMMIVLDYRTGSDSPRVVGTEGVNGGPEPGIYHRQITSTFDEFVELLGKPYKVIAVACMRKLLGIMNTMIKTNSMWNPQCV
ncbi:MAG: hypothetical protein CMJ46_08350 [Planctomyces sp.]|nr:hypothetical protein [Planctomyces sp.]